MRAGVCGSETVTKKVTTRQGGWRERDKQTNTVNTRQSVLVSRSRGRINSGLLS